MAQGLARAEPGLAQVGRSLGVEQGVQEYFPAPGVLQGLFLRQVFFQVETACQEIDTAVHEALSWDYASRGFGGEVEDEEGAEDFI